MPSKVLMKAKTIIAFKMDLIGIQGVVSPALLICPLGFLCVFTSMPK